MQNALAGGGAFITLPSLMLTGMDARAADMTSTIALFPAQIATGWTGAIIGGIAGAHLLQRVNERALRLVVMLIGVALTVGVFMRAP